MDDEAEWIQRARAGDREAFARLVEVHREVAYRTAFWILRDADDAMDVTQEAFLRAYRSLNRFAERSSFRTWLRRIATNAALDRRQRRLREPELPEDLEPAARGPSASERLAQAETRALVREAIDALPPASRAAVVLRDVHGLSYAEIAETLKIPKGTVMSRIHKGRQILRRRLADVLGPRAEVLQQARQTEVGT
ncbi:MAG: sigma-70 family RNA polymerase sigma factor [Planctomycetota bacterium]